MVNAIGNSGCNMATLACSSALSVNGLNPDGMAAGTVGANADFASISRTKMNRLWNLPRAGQPNRSILRVDAKMGPAVKYGVIFRIPHEDL